jgi:hypothetical protein
VVNVAAHQLRERIVRTVGDILMKQLEIGHGGVRWRYILSRPNAARRTAVTQIAGDDANAQIFESYVSERDFCHRMGRMGQTFPISLA